MGLPMELSKIGIIKNLHKGLDKNDLQDYHNTFTISTTDYRTFN
jgi:hypothetical protein